MTGFSHNELVLTSPEPDAIAEALEQFKHLGRRTPAIYTDGTMDTEFLVTESARQNLAASIMADSTDVASVAAGHDGLFLAIADPIKLSKLLARLTSVSNTFVWAPQTRHFFRSRPAFVQSVPKSGTHVLFKCLTAFGYAAPPSLDLPDFEASFDNGVFYNLQHMPTSCLSSPYQHIPRFVDAISRSVVLFIVRDPRDVVVSFAYYLASQAEYHISSSLFRNMSAQERIDRVIAGDYPIPIYLNRHKNLDGSIEDLFESYRTWWSDVFPNVWRIRFEDIIGPKGGGDGARQAETIWGLQLALHVPGCPAHYCDRVFSKDALTFRRGLIGDYLIDFSLQHHSTFTRLENDLLPRLGYADRWQLQRAFVVVISLSSFESAMTIASQLRAELANHGRAFGSITINECRGEASGDHRIEICALGIGDAGAQDSIILSPDIGGEAPIQSGKTGERRYLVEIKDASSTPTLVNEIVESLVRNGFVHRLSASASRGGVNSRFEGEVPPVAHEKFGGPLPGSVPSGAPSIQLIEDTPQYNLLQIGTRFIALAKALGPTDVFVEPLGQRDLPPHVLTGDRLDQVREKALAIEAMTK